MSVPVPIKERIALELFRRLGNISEVSQAERWSQFGNTRAADSVVMIEGDESEGGEESSGGADVIELAELIQFQACLAKPRTQADTSADHNAWLARLEEGLIGGVDGPLVLEDASSVRLAIDAKKTRTLAPPVSAEQPEAYAILEIEVRYQHYRGNPYEGPGIARLEV